MTKRDRSLVEHLAVKVLTWKPVRNWEHVWDVVGSYRGDINLDSWADAGMVWEKARKKEIELQIHGDIEEWRAFIVTVKDLRSIGEIVADSGPRAICEAVAKATGWEETT